MDNGVRHATTSSTQQALGVKSGASDPTVLRGADEPKFTGDAGPLLVRDLNAKLHLVELRDAATNGVRRFK